MVAEPARARTQAPPTLAEQAPVMVAPPRPIDLTLLGAVFALIVVGTIEVYSSSAVYALKKTGDPTYFLDRQLMWLALGIGALWLGVKTDYRWLRRRTYSLLFVAVALLVLVLLVGATINSAKRWFIIGPLSFQPVELAKLSLITYLAYSLSKKGGRLDTFAIGFAPHLLVCCVMMALLLKQPDLGSSIILAATTITMLFVAGTRTSHIVLSVLAAAPVAYLFIVGTPWRMQRFLAYFNPEAFSDGVAYQIVQGLIAVGSGGATGLGLGDGLQQLGYMPEGHSDFIVASIGEELGFVGMVSVLGLFAILVWRGARTAIGARDPFGAYLAFGITIGFAFQALINFGVVLGVLPAKGLTLPFVSYGGSSLIVSLYLVGVLLNIGQGAPPRPARHRRRAVINIVGARRRRKRARVSCAS